jgi:hypothetical protein
MFGHRHGADQGAVVLQVGDRVTAVRGSDPDIATGIDSQALRPGVTMWIRADKMAVGRILINNGAGIECDPDVAKWIFRYAPRDARKIPGRRRCFAQRRVGLPAQEVAGGPKHVVEIDKASVTTAADRGLSADDRTGVMIDEIEVLDANAADPNVVLGVD